MERPTDLLWLHARLADLVGRGAGVGDLAALVAAWPAIASAEGDLFGRTASVALALDGGRPFVGANRALAAAAAGLLLRAYDLDLALTVADMPSLGALLDARDASALMDWLRARTRPLNP